VGRRRLKSTNWAETNLKHPFSKESSELWNDDENEKWRKVGSDRIVQKMQPVIVPYKAAGYVIYYCREYT
jgi:hypothetical protein